MLSVQFRECSPLFYLILKFTALKVDLSIIYDADNDTSTDYKKDWIRNRTGGRTTTVSEKVLIQDAKQETIFRITNAFFESFRFKLCSFIIFLKNWQVLLETVHVRIIRVQIKRILISFLYI